MKIPEDEWETYFQYEHLPERLRRASAPFCMLALDILKSQKEPNFPQLMCWITEELPECRQRIRCLEKLERSEEALHGVFEGSGTQRDHALDLLLEAKDCAVRTLLSNSKTLGFAHRD